MTLDITPIECTVRGSAQRFEIARKKQVMK